jgi:isopentenyl diphosphate isomerase/L-lactate dehydrogenase-like FMN-dependent dehydrogenase
LQTLMKNGDDAVAKLIINWFEYLKKVMFLTGSDNLTKLKNGKIIKKEELF